MLTKPPILDETGQKILAGIRRVKDILTGTNTPAVAPGSAGISGTSPVMQDDTGRDIISALNDLGDACKVTSTSTITDIITAATNITINGAWYYAWGKMAQIYINCKSSQDITVIANGNITDTTIGTIVSGKRTKEIVRLSGWNQNDDTMLWFHLTTAGAVTLACGMSTGAQRTIAAGTKMIIAGTYLLP